MDISGALPEAIKIIFRDELWTKSIDYEHIPFRCRKFHEHGHLYRDCPQNKSTQNNEHAHKEKDKQGFTKVTITKPTPDE